MARHFPIGVFDSGVGGLSVLRDIRRELWNEDLIYVADSIHAPYGDKSVEFIEARSLSIAEFLVGQPVKALVVACNTATAAAVRSLRSRFKLPIIAMEPAIKPAVAQTKTGVVGVLATRGTLGSESFSNLVCRYGSNVDIRVQACPGLVEQVEEGDLSGEKTRELLSGYVQPLLERNADIIVLGCTHYPFLAPLIQSLAGPGVAVIDPGVAVARELRRRLNVIGQLSESERPGQDAFWTSDCPVNAANLIPQLWGAAVEVRILPERFRRMEGPVDEV